MAVTMEMVLFIFTIFIQTSITYGEEPSCPKDFYDHKILEQVLETKHGIKEVNAAVDKVLNKLDQQGQVEKDLVNIKQNITNLSKQAEDLESRIRELEFKLLKKENRENSGRLVAFSASLSAIATQDTAEVVIFDRVITNVGNHYDKTSGHFTAPHNGIYMFTSSLLANNGREIWGRICSKGKSAGKCLLLNANPSGSRHDHSSQSMIIELSEGDTVTVSGGPSIYGGHYSTFSGYMIQGF